MIRLFLDSALKKEAEVSLNDKAYHYLVHVMRCQEGDPVLCFNGREGEWLATLHMPSKKHAVLIITKQTQKQKNPPFCALCPALIKKDKMDFVLQKATELGATDIYPLITDYTAHAHFNLEHAKLIVQEAAEQCERLTLPNIHHPQNLSQAFAELSKNCVCCYLAERTDAKNILSQKDNMAFFVGPEGGWSQKELVFFEKHPFVPLHFSVGILRAETASLAILSCWQIGRELQIKK